MDSKTVLYTIILAITWTGSTANPSPQFYPPQQQAFSNAPQDSTFTNAQPWAQTLQNNFSSAHFNFLDPLASPAADEILKNNIPRQLYGAPPPPTATNTGYPQIYKIDNLIIIANPPPQQQPCFPQRPPPQFPNPGGGDDGLSNRFGEEPSKCTWAIVACCAPGNNNVRYNCFELLGCPGFFFDNSPCSPDTVMAATSAALEYYRSANSGNSTGTDTNRV